MKIVHIAPNAPYNDNWGYQENLLPKYQKRLGHDVTVITTNTMHKDGRITETDCADYVLHDGVRVIRLKVKQYPHYVLTNLKARLPVGDILKQIRPDLIFFHGLVSDTIYDAVAYKKKCNPNCVIVRDNHMDYNIGNAAVTWKQKLIRGYFRFVNKRTAAYTAKVYGVTPWRKAYAEDYFAIPADKTDVLIMGADDEKIDFANHEAIRARLREEYDIADTDFLVVTGGKLDAKKNVCQLMEAVRGMENVKLLIFGQVHEQIKADFDALLEANKNIIYIGWLDADRVYDYFFAADLVCFPGQHSVLWEQACASKVPCLFQKWEGMDHVNNGGNSDFISPVTVENLSAAIKALCFTEKYYNMNEIAKSGATDCYLYSRIAEKSLESVGI